MSFYYPGSPIKDIEVLIIQLNSDQGSIKKKNTTAQDKEIAINWVPMNVFQFK